MGGEHPFFATLNEGLVTGARLAVQLHSVPWCWGLPRFAVSLHVARGQSVPVHSRPEKSPCTRKERDGHEPG